MGRVIDFNVHWETDICKECNFPCADNEEPCLPLEMLRQLVKMTPGEQVQSLMNLKDWFNDVHDFTNLERGSHKWMNS